jgi:3-deoxy-D-manno-octulosonic acid kinase
MLENNNENHSLNEQSFPLVRIRTRGYRVFGRQKFSKETINSFLDLLEKAENVDSNNAKLKGRTPLIESNIDPIGEIILKRYRRGGLLSWLLSNTHSRITETRSRLEFNLLNKVRNLGVKAPEPMVYIEKGEFFYNGWLVTKKIPGAVNLIDFIKSNPDKSIIILNNLAIQIKLLIKNGIHHIDLHPGNVVVDDKFECWIVDFDKGLNFSGSKIELRNKYLRRWRRAVIKHKLPEVMSEVIALELRDHV